MPIGDNNGIIVTNDNGLNQIFQDYNVRAFELLDGISLPDYYGLVCSCDATQLKLELDNYNSVISSSEYATTTFLLSIKNTDIQEVTIYPNPFQNSIDISNSNLVEKFQLFDILGKRLFNSKEKAAFVDFSETLKGGIYILKLSDYEGNSILKKLIKN
ncbi:MAG: T9SS type A sorting domain-containing protein [Flavobacteriaceae bacterium]